jgi:protein phosphatase
MKITIPELSLVVLIGVSGSGKSTFARKHFKSTEILSSDYCRGLVSDDENSQAATKDAFEVLHFIARKRLAAGKLTVVDATNVQPESRKSLVEIAREFHCLPVAIALDLPERVAHDRNKGRPDRDFGPHVIRQQSQQLHRSLRGLEREGFRHVFVLKSLEEIEAATIERQPLWNNLKREHGPFDIIGDVHGCLDELVELVGKLGYTEQPGGAWKHPEGRKLLFAGDLVDRGPKIPDVVRLVLESVNAGTARCVPGNHDMKFMRKIWGKDVQITHGLAESLAQFEAYEQAYRGFSRIAADFIHKLVSHYVLDDGKLVVAHAGMKESMQGRGSGAVREFALFGETTGENDEFGLPVRYNWAAEYRGSAMVVYGHTPVPEPEWLNRTINIDTGCVFGGKLTALRYPEKEIVSVPAKNTYAESRKPFLPAETQAPVLSAQHIPGASLSCRCQIRIFQISLSARILLWSSMPSACPMPAKRTGTGSSVWRPMRNGSYPPCPENCPKSKWRWFRTPAIPIPAGRLYSWRMTGTDFPDTAWKHSTPVPARPPTF